MTTAIQGNFPDCRYPVGSDDMNLYSNDGADIIDEPSYESDVQSVEDSRLMSFEALVRQVFGLLKRNVVEYRETLFQIETLSKQHWHGSVQEQISSMRCWTSQASKIGGIALALVSAVPHIHPGAIEGGVQSLVSSGFLPDLLARFSGNINKISKAATGAISAASTVQQQIDRINDNRLDANKTEHGSGSTMSQDAHQKHANYRQEEDKRAQDLIAAIAELEQSMYRTIQQIMR